MDGPARGDVQVISFAIPHTGGSVLPQLLGLTLEEGLQPVTSCTLPLGLMLEMVFQADMISEIVMKPWDIFMSVVMNVFSCK